MDILEGFAETVSNMPLIKRWNAKVLVANFDAVRFASRSMACLQVTL